MGLINRVDKTMDEPPIINNNNNDCIGFYIPSNNDMLTNTIINNIFSTNYKSFSFKKYILMNTSMIVIPDAKIICFFDNNFDNQISYYSNLRSLTVNGKRLSLLENGLIELYYQNTFLKFLDLVPDYYKIITIGISSLFPGICAFAKANTSWTVIGWDYVFGSNIDSMGTITTYNLRNYKYKYNNSFPSNVSKYFDSVPCVANQYKNIFYSFQINYSLKDIV